MSDNVVFEAAQFAQYWHRDQKRKYNGRPYIEHPGRVAMRVTLLGGSEDMVAIAWLHDVLEDTEVQPWQLGTAFGDDILAGVTALTNPSSLPENKGKTRAQRKKIDRDYLAKAPEEVQVIKLADRLDNLLELAGAPSAFIQLYVEESIKLVEAIGHAQPVMAQEIVDVGVALVQKTAA